MMQCLKWDLKVVSTKISHISEFILSTKQKKQKTQKLQWIFLVSKQVTQAGLCYQQTALVISQNNKIEH